MSFLKLLVASAALTFAQAAAQYGPNGQYGPDSSSTATAASSSSSAGSSYNPYSSSSASSGGFDRGSIPFGGDFAKANKLIITHAVLASLAFVVFFPTGGILIRLASFPGLTWVHAAFQAFAYILFTVAVGIGIYFATQIRQLNQAHPIIGLTVFGLLFFQPILGLLHHRLFKTHQRRVFWSYAHIWLGRFVITLGMINGGLGLWLANNSRKGEIAYGVVAAFMWLAYVASIVIGEMRRRKTRHIGIGGEKTDNGLSRGSGSGSEDESSYRGERTSFGAPATQKHRYF